MGVGRSACHCSERCEVVASNFFATAPAGGDAYLLKDILQDWNDRRALALLTSCHRAMNPGARLLIVEHIIPPGNEPLVGEDLDILVRLTTGGRSAPRRA